MRLFRFSLVLSAIFMAVCRPVVNAQGFPLPPAAGAVIPQVKLGDRLSANIRAGNQSLRVSEDEIRSQIAQLLAVAAKKAVSEHLQEVRALNTRLGDAAAEISAPDIASQEFLSTMKCFTDFYALLMPELLAAVPVDLDNARAQAFVSGGFASAGDNSPEDLAAFQPIVDRLSRARTSRELNYQAYVLKGLGDFAATRGGELILISSDFSDLSADRKAALLAHEMGHLEKRHYTTYAAVKAVNDVLAAQLQAPGAKQALKLAAAAQKRECEFEADAEAVRLMSAAGYKLSALKALLKSLGGGKQPTTPDGDHPSNAERIAKLGL